MRFPILDNDNTFPEDCAVKKWADLALQGASVFNRPLDSSKDYKTQMIAAGFQNVVELEFKWPQNNWPKDTKLKELGRLIHQHFGYLLTVARNVDV